MCTERDLSQNYNGERADLSTMSTVRRAQLEKNLQLNQPSNIDISLKLRSFHLPAGDNNYEQKAFKRKAPLIKRPSNLYAVILTQSQQNLHQNGNLVVTKDKNMNKNTLLQKFTLIDNLTKQRYLDMNKMKIMQVNTESVEATMQAKVLSYKNQLITKPIRIKDLATDAAPTGTPQITTVNKENIQKNIKIQQNNNIVLPVANIRQASANSNVADIASGKAKSSINAQKARHEQTGPVNNNSIDSYAAKKLRSAVNIKDILSKDLKQDPLDQVLDVNDIALEQQIGSGNCSIVYRSIWKGIKIAIKKIKFQNIKDNNFKELKREIGTLVKLECHDNIVSLAGVCQQGDNFYIVNDFYESGTIFKLLHCLHNIPITWEQRHKIS